MNKLDKKVKDDVEKYGWHCLSVAPRVGEDGAGFSYTIGLNISYDHPEIIVFGLGSRQAHDILTGSVDMIETGNPFPLGTPVPNVLGKGFNVVFKTMKPAFFNEYMGMAVRYYGHREFEARVLFWPDRQNRFVWESQELSSQAEALNVV